jgi:excisionase family DNA binding protein
VNFRIRGTCVTLMDMKEQSATPEWLTRAEVAALFRITTRGVGLMRADGRLKAYRAGERIIRFRRDEVEAALQPID